jgi:hypothetical protein
MLPANVMCCHSQPAAHGHAPAGGVRAHLRLTRRHEGQDAPFQPGRQPHRKQRRRRSASVRSALPLAQLADVGPVFSELAALLRDSPALRDTCATITAVLGATALIKAFDVFTYKGWLDQARVAFASRAVKRCVYF